MLLLARQGRPVSVDELVEALWGETPDTRAGQRLQLHVHRLRRVLGEADRVVFDSGGYRLLAMPGEVDAQRFEALAARGVEAVEGDPRRAVGVLREALGLWRGVPFAGVDAPVLGDWGHRLGERRLAAVEALFRAELGCGRGAAVVAELAEWVREYPLRERLHGLLMVALCQAGRQAEALAAFRSARRVLKEELGLEPGPELREVERCILAGEHGDAGVMWGLPASAAPGGGGGGGAVPAQLPGDAPGFVGREEELAELDRLLDGPRPSGGTVAVSVVAGTAGVGKTALAVRWAHRMRERFPDGQFYVDLRGWGPDQPVAPEDALAGFLRALGLGGAAMPQDPAERAARFRSLVDGRRMLLVLDNARTAAQVRPLLPGSRGCFTLVTSRDALAGLVAREGARRIVLDRLPAGQALRLLREMAGRRVADEPAVARELVRRCARLPLALRIAAELIRSQPAVPLADVAAELADRHDALDALDLDGDPHTAVRAVFASSYRQLDPDAARVFRLFGVHPGQDTDAYALAAMNAAPPRSTRRVLDTLHRAHLVDQTAPHRYQSHDLLRAYAAELAAGTGATPDRDTALARLRDYYLTTATAAIDIVAPYDHVPRPQASAPSAPAPSFSDYGQARRWLDTERANLLEMTRHAAPAYIIGMSHTIWRYLDVGGYHDEAITLHNRALRAAPAIGDRLGEAHARRILSIALTRTGTDPEAAVDHLERALAIYRQAGNRALEAATLNNLGWVCGQREELTKAGHYLEEALEVIGPDAGWRMRAIALTNLARNRRSLGWYEEALRLLEHSLELCAAHGDNTIEANAHCVLADVYARMGRVDDALDHAYRGLAQARECGYPALEALCVCKLGNLRRAQGDHERALRLHEEAVALARTLGDSELIAQTLNARAATHAVAGQPDQALRLHREALAVAERARHRTETAHALAGIGDRHAELGEQERAREHWRQALDRYAELGVPEAETMRARLAPEAEADAEAGPEADAEAIAAACLTAPRLTTARRESDATSASPPPGQAKQTQGLSR
ncbi:BTAD domain-containing putative transcriptional regulator [Streptomyces sp. 6N223]|uniref:BTAD domain-containing putative transcriptional regulator n=1 Tax=Streptomyces sp. 6N223 TaxID=3457412 RepID=UPI003FD46B1E